MEEEGAILDPILHTFLLPVNVTIWSLTQLSIICLFLKTQERLLEELKQLQKEDLARRRQTVAQMPPQLVELPYRRGEVKEDWHRELEFAFEDMYNADRSKGLSTELLNVWVGNHICSNKQCLFWNELLCKKGLHALDLKLITLRFLWLGLQRWLSS